MHKRVQEGNARKLTSLSILMHLSKQNSPDYIGFAQGFPTAMYNEKEENLTYITYLHLLDVHSEKFGPH